MLLNYHISIFINFLLFCSAFLFQIKRVELSIGWVGIYKGLVGEVTIHFHGSFPMINEKKGSCLMAHNQYRGRLIHCGVVNL